jgi:hypothetical protein
MVTEINFVLHLKTVYQWNSVWEEATQRNETDKFLAYDKATNENYRISASINV